ncbi:MAG: ABC transporter permease subunit [Lachnospiraceae bacterium]|nr:ABC transporter permease subunit [Lachnospiraceae bacterium]
MNFLNMLEQISSGMLHTILIFFFTLIFSLPLGWIVAFGRMSKNKIISGITAFFISILRGTPLMLQLMVVFYGPYFLFNLPIGNWRFPAIIVGFSINYAAYFAEIYRSGISVVCVDAICFVIENISM